MIPARQKGPVALRRAGLDDAPRDDAVAEGAAHRGVVPVLAITAMLGAMNGISLNPFMVEISRDLSTTPAMLGQITALIFLGSTAVGLFAGPLGDQYGRRQLLIGGLAIVVVSAFATMVAPSYGWLLLGRLLSAVSGGLMAGTTMAMAATLFDGPERRKAISTISGGIALTPIVGVPTLTFIASLSSWRVAYVVIGLLALLWMQLVFVVLPGDSRRDAGRINVRQVFYAYQPLVRSRVMLMLYGSTLTRSMGFIGMVSYAAAYYGQEFGLSVREIGWVTMVSGASYLLGTKVSGTSLGGASLRTICGGATIVSGIAMGLAFSSPLGVISIVPLLAVAAAGAGMGWVALLSLVSTETPAGQGTTMSLNAAMFTLGGSLGAFSGALLLTTGGYAALGIGLAVFCFAGASLVWMPGLHGHPGYGKPTALE